MEPKASLRPKGLIKGSWLRLNLIYVYTYIYLYIHYDYYDYYISLLLYTIEGSASEFVIGIYLYSTVVKPIVLLALS